ncbi:MAG: SIR2 family NAD-dependent protein deacylase [candidate division WOR-3 bacterium]
MDKEDADSPLRREARELARASGGFQRVVVLTGAGVSSDSGIPTFRDPGGVWERFRPEDLASPDAFARDPKLVWDWYRARAENVREAQPNPGHIAIAEMEAIFPDFHLITQNVDGLHHRAGSRRVIELHGNLGRARCTRCPSVFPLEHAPVAHDGMPHCPSCAALARPDIVWFGEALPVDALEQAFDLSSRAQVFFSVGTSGLVQPAASLPFIAKRAGALIVEVNPNETSLSADCDFIFRASSSEALPIIVEAYHAL